MGESVLDQSRDCCKCEVTGGAAPFHYEEYGALYWASGEENDLGVRKIDANLASAQEPFCTVNSITYNSVRDNAPVFSPMCTNATRAACLGDDNEKTNVCEWKSPGTRGGFDTLTACAEHKRLHCESVADMVVEKIASPCGYLEVMINAMGQDHNPFQVDWEGGRSVRSGYLGYPWINGFCVPLLLAFTASIMKVTGGERESNPCFVIAFAVAMFFVVISMYYPWSAAWLAGSFDEGVHLYREAVRFDGKMC